MDQEKRHIFWTGGFDSTFWLLQLLFHDEILVQPHYLVRSEECTGGEINTINNILRYISKNYSKYRYKILPVEYKNANALSEVKDIKNYYEKLVSRKKINKQYYLMSLYCIEYEINQIDVCLTNLSNENELSCGNNIIFDRFNYPIINYSKKEMYNKSINDGYSDLLLLTSFCRRPINNNKPCGKCGPCIDVVDSSLSFRLPFMARVKANLQLPFRKYWREKLSKNDNNLANYINRKLKGRF